MQTLNGNISKQGKQLPTANCSLLLGTVELHALSAFTFSKALRIMRN